LIALRIAERNVSKEYSNVRQRALELVYARQKITNKEEERNHKQELWMQIG